MKEPLKFYQEGPKFFYKYQKVTKYTLQNLVADQLWMSQVTNFNDPFEFKYHLLNSQILTKEEQNNIFEFLGCGVICLASHPELTKNPNQEDSMFYPDNMLMWSHYSDNHYGFCLDLRKKAIIYKVNYSDLFPTVDPDHQSPLIAQFILAMHTKQKCWEYENEYRALNLNLRNAGLPCKNSYELERIYFGLRTPKGDEDLVRNILNDRDIIYFRAKLNEKFYKIEFDKV